LNRSTPLINQCVCVCVCVFVYFATSFWWIKDVDNSNVGPKIIFLASSPVMTEIRPWLPFNQRETSREQNTHSQFFAPAIATVSLILWPCYTNMTYIFRRFTRIEEMNFVVKAFKIQSPNRTYRHVFLLLRPWTWPNDLDIPTWPRYFEVLPAYEK